jgi:hypothetical protein
MASKNTETNIAIPEIKIGDMEVVVVGGSPLIVHAWSQKAKQEMLSKHMKEAKSGGKDAKDPWQDFQESLYRLDDGGYGFPSVGFKAAAVTACTSIDGVTKVAARQAFHITGEQIAIQSVYKHQGQTLTARYDMVRIMGSEPEMREDMVRLGGMGNPPDIRYRAQFWPWYCRLKVSFNTGSLSQAQIVNLVNVAGFGVGVGEWRPERDGTYGRFRVAAAADLKWIDSEERKLRRARAA